MHHYTYVISKIKVNENCFYEVSLQDESNLKESKELYETKRDPQPNLVKLHGKRIYIILNLFRREKIIFVEKIRRI